LKDLAAKYGIENQTEFVGQVNRQWVKSNLKNYHLLIQPSLFEGFGITVIEGFACGLPVIASDLDGPKEICGLLNAGLLVHPNDPVDLSEKIAWVYQSYLSNDLKDKNYLLRDKNQLKIFDIQTTAKAYMENYHSV
jgi:glycosyltransferase involved in cell wall biosynthesis